VNLLTLLPAKYAKALGGFYLALSTYLSAYGLTWHLNGALLAISGILGVTFIPNKPGTAPVIQLGDYLRLTPQAGNVQVATSFPPPVPTEAPPAPPAT
jgi:hypothetical protein